MSVAGLSLKNVYETAIPLLTGPYAREWTVTYSPSTDGLIVRGTVLGVPERLTFDAPTMPGVIAHAIDELIDYRWSEVGPEFRQAMQLASRPFKNVDPYGRPVA